MTDSSTSHHITIDPKTSNPAPYRGVMPEVFRHICATYLKLSGWKIEGDWPKVDKMVLVAAPHTSNWDGVNMLAAAGFYRSKLKWMGKKSLTTGPFGGIVKWLGCVPIDRSARHDVVAQMKTAFENAKDMVLAVPPEGTRSLTNEWKTGFYHIAHTANVPIVMSVLDYGAKTLGISGVLYPSGDIEADMKLIKSHYAKAVGKHPDKFSLGAV